MPMLRGRFVEFVVALGLLSGVPLAQAASGQAPQQTPENAQRFLAQIWPASFTLTASSWAGTAVVRRLSPLTATRNNCGTSFQGIFPEPWRTAQEFGFGWENVAEVIHGTGSSTVRINFKDGIIGTYDFGSGSLGDRAAFAMEFLRQACDPTANTGF